MLLQNIVMIGIIALLSWNFSSLSLLSLNQISAYALASWWSERKVEWIDQESPFWTFLWIWFTISSWLCYLCCGVCWTKFCIPRALTFFVLCFYMDQNSRVLESIVQGAFPKTSMFHFDNLKASQGPLVCNGSTVWCGKNPRKSSITLWSYSIISTTSNAYKHAETAPSVYVSFMPS